MGAAVVRERLGSYELLMRLAAGGMGVVDVARKVGDGGFERLVVVKRVHRHLLENQQFREMLRDEARVAALLRHPNVVPLFDVVDTGDELALVLEYVESVSLSVLLAALGAHGRRMPPAIAARVVCDALAGLHAAHEVVALDGTPLDLIHRDVSPQNVIVGSDGTSRLIDFGVAKAAVGLVRSDVGLLKGKLAYMAPEQATRRPLDRRTDVFSAGAVLYEALTGERIHPAGADDAEVLLGLLVDEPRRPSEVAPEVPRALDELVMRALARDPEERFATAREMEEAIEGALRVPSRLEVARLVEEIAGPHLTGRRDALLALARAAPAVAASPSTAPRSSDRAPRRRTGLVVVAALIAAASVASVAIHLDRRASRASSPAPSGGEPLASETTADAGDSATAATVATAATPAEKAALASAPAAARPSTAPTPAGGGRGRGAGARAGSSDLHRANPYSPR